MIETAVRPLLFLRQLQPMRPPTSFLRRHLSVQTTFPTFPASLLRYSPRQKSSLFDVKDSDQRGDDPLEDAITVAARGLVYPGSALPEGAVLMPNTYMMQEIIRRHFDCYVDLEEAGHDVEQPLIFRIPKGTPITSHLVLYHEYTGRFRLQPSRAMPLGEFNQSLDEFYETYAEKKTVEEWLDENPFHSAVPDDDYTKWTSG